MTFISLKVPMLGFAPHGSGPYPRGLWNIVTQLSFVSPNKVAEGWSVVDLPNAQVMARLQLRSAVACNMQIHLTSARTLCKPLCEQLMLQVSHLIGRVSLTGMRNAE